MDEKRQSLRPKEQWAEAFERQFPDLIDNPIARMCYREGWANAPYFFSEQEDIGITI